MDLRRDIIPNRNVAMRILKNDMVGLVQGLASLSLASREPRSRTGGYRCG